MNFPEPQSFLEAIGLPASSHLYRVLASEVARLKTFQAPDLPTILPLPGRFEAALRRDQDRCGGAVIAEYKQASPSLGPFALGTSLHAQLEAYREGGAACFSILIEPTFFLGQVTHLVEGSLLGVPTLYKGFVMAESQLREAVASGASAVLLIARVLKNQTAAFAHIARNLGLKPLVELHDLTEVPLAQEAKARLVGINARDLSTFTLGVPSAAPLREAFPDAVLIRESGLSTPEDVAAAFRAGFDAVLMGEALMRSRDPKDFLCRIFAGTPPHVG